METTKVENMRNNSGREVVNQFVIYTPEGRYFQSYKSVIAFVPFGGGQILIDANKWDYSTTTGKYRNLFLGETKPATQKKIDDGIYKLVDLN